MSLGRTLKVSLLSGFQPLTGSSFDILDWGTLSGTYSAIQLPALMTGIWNTSQLYSSGVLSIVAGLPGDYSQNGIVDAADYIVWRDALGSTAILAADGSGNGKIDAGDYDVWKADFGRTLATTGLTADYNHNGGVDVVDYTLWRDTLGSTTGLAADGNGRIDSGDFDVWKANYGNHSGAGAVGAATASVPEPATPVLLFAGIVALLSCRLPSMS
jgi:hypothetical protein